VIEWLPTIITIVLAVGGAFAFLEKRRKIDIKASEDGIIKLLNTVKEALEKEMETMEKTMEKEIQDVKERAAEAHEHGRMIEQNYNSKFASTNSNITITREQMLIGFGELKGLIQTLSSKLDHKE